MFSSGLAVAVLDSGTRWSVVSSSSMHRGCHRLQEAYGLFGGIALTLLSAWARAFGTEWVFLGRRSIVLT